MDEINKNGGAIDYEDKAAVAQIFYDSVPNQVTRSILFGEPADVESTVANLRFAVYPESVIGIMKSVVNTAFLIALCRWKDLWDNPDWGNSRDLDYFRNSRFSKLFQSAIGKEDITYDLQIFAIIELWVCMKDAPGHVREQFAGIFDVSLVGDDIGLTLQNVRDTIRNASFRQSGSLDKYTAKYCNELCCRLLKSFVIFKSVKIKYPDDLRIDDPYDFAIEYYLSNLAKNVVLYPNKLFGKADDDDQTQDGDSKKGEGLHLILTFDQLLKIKAKQAGNDEEIFNSRMVSPYILVETTAFNGKLQHTYRSFDGTGETRIETDPHVNMNGVVEKNEDIVETRKFLSFNYGNIREFALVVSDAIKNNPTKRSRLFNECKTNHEKIIADIKDADAPDIYWDNIITLMIVEMGPSDFLELIIDNDNIFDSILENVGWRMIGTDKAEKFREQYENECAALQKICALNEQIFFQQRTELRARIILRAIGFDKTILKEIHPFEESLSFKYAKILAHIDVLKRYGIPGERIDPDECYKSAEGLTKIFKDIFIFLQIFYCGLDAYAMKKENLPISSHKKNKNGPPEYHKACFGAFSAAAEKKYHEIKNQSLTESFEAFCNLCELYNSGSGGSDFNISEHAGRMKRLITRNYICDVAKLRFFAEIEFPNGEKSTIFEMIGNLGYKYTTQKKFCEWLTYFQDLFLFLIYNEDYYKHGLFNEEDGVLKDKDCDPIYPYLVTYYRENVDRDNLKKCSYRVPVPTNGLTAEPRDQGFVVTLLTEEFYLPNTYFCIPLRYGSSESWWINPFLIPRGAIMRMFINDDEEEEEA
ncbi:MAG: hypothetical protein J1G04_04675 [Clostridiales bacterium]|nr:hypothetical protein [Clostridiales bacterium]